MSKLAKRINANTLRFAKGITQLPFYVPQFREGGQVNDLFQQPRTPTLNERLPKASSNAATQSQQLRANVNNQYKSYAPKPVSSQVNLGDTSVKPFPAVRGLGASAFDLGLAQQIAGNAAERYNGYGADKVKAMFPKYKDGGEVEPTEKDGYGLIQGEGTGTSDSIDANLQAEDYIIPAAVVAKFGAEELLALIEQNMPEQREGDNTIVPAKVSNGEIRVPKEVVQKLGVEFFDNLKEQAGVPDLSKQVEGKPAYAFNGLVNDEELARTLRNNVDSYPANQNRFGYQGVPSTKQLSTNVRTGSNLVPQGDLVSPKNIEPLKSARTLPNNGFTLEGGPYSNVNYKQPSTSLALDDPNLKFKRSEFNSANQANAFRQKYGATNLGDTSVSRNLGARGLGGTGVDVNSALQIASNAASQYKGPYAEKVKAFFPADASQDASKYFSQKGVDEANNYLKQQPQPQPLQQRLDSTQRPTQQITQQPTQNKDRVNPNIYGPGGKNYGPNPTDEQVNEIFGRGNQNQTSQLDQYKDYLEAQNQALDRANINNQFYVDLYGTSYPTGNLDFNSAFGPQQLQSSQNIADSQNRTELEKANILKTIEQLKLDQPQYSALRDPDNGTVDVYQSSGNQAKAFNIELNRNNLLQKNPDAQRALSLLNDVDRAKPEERKKALSYLQSLGYFKSDG